jgi:hypothetical protein
MARLTKIQKLALKKEQEKRLRNRRFVCNSDSKLGLIGLLEWDDEIPTDFLEHSNFVFSKKAVDKK